MRDERWSLRSGPAVPAVFAAWTLFVWVGRFRNLRADPEPTGRWTAVGVAAFVILGAVLAASLVRGRLTGNWRRDAGPAVAALAALTTVVWLIRAIEISFDDHPAGFIAVHVVLAVVSIALAAGSVLAWRSPAPGETTVRDDGERAAVGYPRNDG